MMRNSAVDHLISPYSPGCGEWDAKMKKMNRDNELDDLIEEITTDANG